METNLLRVMRACRNFFVKSRSAGTYGIASGILSPLDGVLSGQYILIAGSVLNDGVYRLGEAPYTLDGTTDEVFDGVVYGLAVPADFLALADEIEAHEQASPTGAVKSESFGAYSYTKATGESGAVLTWEQVFASKLTPYRRMFPDAGVV